MSSRTALLLTTAVLALVLAVLVVWVTPWRPLPLHGLAPVPADAARDFSLGEIARAAAYHAALRPPAYASFLLGLLVAVVFGFTRWGARLTEAVAAPLGGGWLWRLLLGTLALTLVARAITLPWDAWGESVRRRYGLSTRTWGGWAVDVAKAYGVGLVLTLALVLLVVGLAHWQPRWWWATGAAVGALLVVVVSFAYPVVVEPVFNKFTPMSDGALRSSLLELARRDGVPVEDVLVADASRRTSSLNAYVSGIGATRRIVVYDTLVAKATPEQVRLIVAHELGHAKNRDVVWGTVLGALGVALLVCALGWVGRWSWLLDRAGVAALGDGRAVALVLALVAVLTVVSGPMQTLLSRRIETRADVHALDRTRDPAAMVSMQRNLSVTNLSDLDPPAVEFVLFATHPSGPQRIALAREWARVHDAAIPPGR